MIRPFLIALQFLTRLPVALHGDLNERDLGRSLLYYPLIGLTLGLLLAASYWLLGSVPVFLRAVLLLVIWVAITGGLHLDGLADSADAWVGGHGDRERTLAIMKDPCSGPMGMVAVALTLLVKLGALAALCESQDPIGLVVVPVLGRTVLLLLFLTTPYVRPGGLGVALAAHLPRRAAGWVLLASSILVCLLAGAIGILLLLSTGCVFLLLRAAMQRRLAGATGDSAGAMVELAEAVGLTGAVIGGPTL
jgi:adenosylcobinamide-GDP ribazoletransferase